MEWPDTRRGVFAISVAAELAGLHPQTLRIYEREGLVDPARSSGGTRRYSGEDVERLRLIATLTTAGLNLAGVKQVLALQEEVVGLRATIEHLDSELRRQRKANRAR
jgi:MerR family transcriptional regulator/heat shock protein HspR